MVSHRVCLAAIALVAAALGPTAMAQDAAGPDAPAERILVPVPAGWSPVGGEETESVVATTYARSQNQMLAVQRLLDAATTPAPEIGARLARDMASRCQDADLSRGEVDPVDGRPAYGLALTCRSEGENVEMIRALIVQGEADAHLILRMWRGPADSQEAPDSASEAWPDFFDDIGYCPAGGCD